jgi:PAS domain-containing protein
MRQLRITTISALASTLALILVIGVLVAYVSKASYHMVSDLQSEALEQTATIVARAAENAIQQSVDVASSLAEQEVVRAALRGGSATAAQGLMASYVKAFPQYWSFFVFDAKGKIVAGQNAEGKSLAGGDRFDRDYSKAIFSGKPVAFSRGVMKATSGDTLVYVTAKAVRDADGALLGAVAVCPRWNAFTADTVDPIKLGKRGYGFMLDASGRIIAHSTEKSLLLKDLSGEDFVRQALRKGKGIIYYPWQGEDKFLFVATVPATKWLVCMSAYEAELAAPAAAQRKVLLLVGLGAIVLMTLVLGAVNRRLVFAPLRALTEFADRIAAGDFKAQLEGRFRAEMAVFADNLRAMVEELKKRLGFSQGVLDGIPTPCGIVGPDFTMIWVNAPMCGLLEKDGPPESYLGQRSGAFFRNDATAKTISDKAIEGRKALSGEFDYTTPSGHQLRVAVNTTPFYDLDGTLLGAISFWTDLTEIYSQKNRIEAQNVAIARQRRGAAGGGAHGPSLAAAFGPDWQIQFGRARAEPPRPGYGRRCGGDERHHSGGGAQCRGHLRKRRRGKAEGPGRGRPGGLRDRGGAGHPRRIRAADGHHAESGAAGSEYRDHYGRNFGHCRPDQPAGP